MPSSSFHPEKAVEFLLARAHLPVLYWLKMDVLGVSAERESRMLCKFSRRRRLLETQGEDGSWPGEKTPGRSLGDPSALLVSALKNLFRLHDFGCTIEDENVRRAAGFLFAAQTKEGDFRAASSREYSPGFHALVLEILALIGMDDDPRVKKGFRWLLAHRQDDGGWAIPCRTISRRAAERCLKSPALAGEKPYQPDTRKPYAHFVTGMALRALAASPSHRAGRDCRKAGELVLRRFFKDDVYADRRSASHWLEMSYPFWSTNILSCLDSLALARFRPEEPAIVKGLEWLKRRQAGDGSWQSTDSRAGGEDHLWLTLAVLRVLKRFGALPA